jgi:hypothetical protein
MQYPRAARRWAVWCAPVILGAALVTSTPSVALAATVTSPVVAVADQSGLHSPRLATRMNAEARADLKDAVRDARPHVPQAIEILALFVVLRFGVRFLRRRHARKWARVHLLLDVVLSPSTELTLQAARRPRKKPLPQVVRLEIAAGRTTNAAFAEIAG